MSWQARLNSLLGSKRFNTVPAGLGNSNSALHCEIQNYYCDNVYVAHLISAVTSGLSSVQDFDVQLALTQAKQHRLSASQAQPDKRRRNGAAPVTMSSQVQIVEEPRTDEER